MKTLTLLVLVGTIAVLIVSGTITLQFHAENLGGIGVWAADQLSHFSVGEQIRDQAISLQRQGEDAIFKDKTKLADTALERAKADSDHLAKLADKTTNISVITPAANLLLVSLDKLTTSTKDITVDHLNQIKPAISDVFAETTVTLAVLKSQNVPVDEFSQKLATITTTIETYIGKLSIPPIVGTTNIDKPKK